MRISDWSSDVCSSDLPRSQPTGDHPQISLPGQAHVAHGPHDQSGMYLMHHAFRRDLGSFESAVRSEEHTSELQSLMRISYAVFCLQKKYRTSIFHHTHNRNLKQT